MRIAGDKAPYKAMTGALKYALLQSFLLAPEMIPRMSVRIRGLRSALSV